MTYKRQSYFSEPGNIARLRQATAMVKQEMPFNIIGAVVLPDHIHFLWTLPPKDINYSKRIGRLKVIFTKMLRGKNALPTNVSISRQKHRESNIWQRRFWEHTIKDELELEIYLNYIHYNPVKHGLVSCPHLWLYSSFHSWVNQGTYLPSWGCTCHGKPGQAQSFDTIENNVGE